MRQSLEIDQINVGDVVVLSVQEPQGPTRGLAADVVERTEEHVILTAYPIAEPPRMLVVRPVQSGFEADSGEGVSIMTANEREIESAKVRRMASQAFISASAIAVGGEPVVRPERPERSPKPAAVPGICYCGCGGATKGGRFVPGHDAIIKGILRRVVRGELTRENIPPLVEENYSNIKFITATPEFLDLFEKVATVGGS